VTKRFNTNSILQAGRRLAGAFVWHVRGNLPRFTADRRGNVAMIFALCSIPILFAVGMAMDYTSAARRRAKLDAIADSAALSAVTPAEFSQTVGQGPTAAQAQAVAQNLFDTLAQTVPGVTSINRTVSVVDTPSGQSSSRVATVSFTAQSQNAFAGVIGLTTLTIGNGNGIVAKAAAAPNINFYVLADSSPSMAIPATTAGINAMYTATSSGSGTGGDNEGGCAFACHESDYTMWVLPGTSSCIGMVPPTKSGNAYTQGTATKPGNVDDYTYAECVLGLTLRIDNLRSAIQQLGPYAYQVSQQGVNGAPANNAAYQMAVATFDTDWSSTACTSGNSPLHYITGSSSLSLVNVTTNTGAQTISTDAANITMLQMFDNSWLTGTNKTSTTSYKQICNNNDGGTALNAAMTSINSLMATPGNGTNTTGDTAQEVLILITDGVNDSYSSSGTRTISTIDTTKCNTIKAKVSSSGLPIRIAVLYLNYSSLPNNSFYTTNVAPFDNNETPTPNPNIATQLQSCASSPSLYQEVTTDQDIGTALKALFLNATATAHLTQ
jgi:Flp pilus assembly protein TadG